MDELINKVEVYDDSFTIEIELSIETWEKLYTEHEIKSVEKLYSCYIGKFSTYTELFDHFLNNCAYLNDESKIIYREDIELKYKPFAFACIDNEKGIVIKEKENVTEGIGIFKYNSNKVEYIFKTAIIEGGYNIFREDDFIYLFYIE